MDRWIINLDKIKNLYNFKLLFCAFCDGFKNKKFHELCDNQYHTVTIIKVKGSDEIFRGYNSVVWKSESHVTS